MTEKKRDRQMPYADYLRSPWWRQRRNRALQLAGWACLRCQSKQSLEVHHKTYERLGEELDADLEVLCERCHKGHHIDEEYAIRLYAAVVSDCLKAERFKTMADLLEAVKVSCVQKNIRYDSRTISRAVQVVDVSRHGIVDAPKPRHTPPPVHVLAQPIGRQEAASILASRGFNAGLRTMPKPTGLTLGDVLRQRAMDQVGRLMLESLRRCEELERDVE